MRLAVLTTDTPHHRWFIAGLAMAPVVVLYERRAGKSVPFMEAEQDAPFGDVRLPERKAMIEVHSANQPGVPEYLRANGIEAAISFGIGKLLRSTFAAPPLGTINVHRGIIERYRGLDSEFWAVHRGERDHIGTTLHFVDDDLDTGAVVAQRRCQPRRFTDLRFATTALQLANEMLKDWPRKGEKRAPGEYFGAMTAAQKAEAFERSAQWTR